MALGELQDRKLMARGWAVRSFSIFFSYASKAALKISSKLVEEGVEVGVGDILLV